MTWGAANDVDYLFVLAKNEEPEARIETDTVLAACEALLSTRTTRHLVLGPNEM